MSEALVVAGSVSEVSDGFRVGNFPKAIRHVRRHRWVSRSLGGFLILVFASIPAVAPGVSDAIGRGAFWGMAGVIGLMSALVDRRLGELLRLQEAHYEFDRAARMVRLNGADWLAFGEVSAVQIERRQHRRDPVVDTIPLEPPIEAFGVCLETDGRLRTIAETFTHAEARDLADRIADTLFVPVWESTRP